MLGWTFFHVFSFFFLLLYKRLQGQSWSDIDEPGIHFRNFLRILGLHVLDKVDDPVGVPELVVVPGHQLHEGRGQLNPGLKKIWWSNKITNLQCMNFMQKNEKADGIWCLFDP